MSGNKELPLAAGLMTLLTIRGMSDKSDKSDTNLVPDLWKVVRTGGVLSDELLRRCLTCIFGTASTTAECSIAASLMALRKGLHKWDDPPVAVENPVAEAFRVLARENADLVGFTELAEAASGNAKDGGILKTVALHTTLGNALELYRNHLRDTVQPKQNLKECLTKYGALDLFNLLDELSRADRGSFQNLLAAPPAAGKPEESVTSLKTKCQELAKELDTTKKTLKRTEDGQKQLHENLKAKTNQASRDHEQRAQERRQQQVILEEMKKQLREYEEKLLTLQQTNGNLTEQVEKLKAEQKKAADRPPPPVLHRPAPPPVAKAAPAVKAPAPEAAPARDDQFSAFYTYIKKHPVN
jgi:hypothetical protein